MFFIVDLPRKAACDFGRILIIPAILACSSEAAHADFVYASSLLSTYSNAVYRIAPDGTAATIATNLKNPYGLAFDHSGNLYVAEEFGGVGKITPSGMISTFAANTDPLPVSLAFDPGGNLYVGTLRLNGSSTISRITPDRSVTRIQTSLAADGGGLAFDSTGDLYYPGGSFIAKIAPDGTSGIFARLSTSLSPPIALAFDSSGTLYVNQSRLIEKISPDGAVRPFATVDRDTYALAFDSGGILYAGGNGFLDKISPDGNVSSFATLGVITGLAVQVPEPRSCALLAILLTGLMRRRQPRVVVVPLCKARL